jgi:HTTM domain
LSRIQSWKQHLTEFLFAPESDSWLAVLRFGLGLQLIFYCFSITGDWSYLLAGRGGLVSRNLSEAMLSFESPIVPRLGWLVTIGTRFGISETGVLSFAWYTLVAVGGLLVLGLFCRPSAIIAWLLHLSAVKSSELISYGVDNLTTIGLFYLMLAPLPDRYSLDSRWFKRRQDPRLVGFWRRVLQTHMCLIYFFGGIAKATGIGWWDGTNLWRSLTRPPFNLLDPHALVHWKFFFPVGGISILLLEATYPIFIWPKRTRLVWLTLICVMHIGIGLALGMYLFALVMIVLNLAAFGGGVLWSDEFALVLSPRPETASAPGD